MLSPRAWGLSLFALAAIIMAGYAVARPTLESLFLATYGTRALPGVWIGVSLGALGVVTLHAHAAARWSPGAVFVRSALLALLTLGALVAAERLRLPGARWLLYVWKDLYIVVLVELFWSLAHTVFTLRTARWLYGLLCAGGSLGGMAGNLGGGRLALAVGTESGFGALMGLVAASLVLAGGLGGWLSAHAPPRAAPKPTDRTVAPGLAGAVQIIRQSPYLGRMVALVAVVQVVVTLVDFQFNGVLVASYDDVDARTVMLGKVYAAIDVSSLVLQLSTGLLVARVGLRGALLATPLIQGAVLLSFAIVPGLALGAVAKVGSKALDYSWFRASKELLYLPLSPEAQTRGKAAVDMLTYRFAKGAASLLLLSLSALALPAALVPWTTAGLVGVWLALTWSILRRYRGLVAAPPAPTPPAGARR